MAIKNGLLSDLQLRHWAKAGEPLAKSDGSGLTFTLSASGCAAWILRYRYGGRRYELTIGRYPDVGLSEARSIAAIKRADVLKGFNPVVEKRKAKTAAVKDMTVRALVSDYKEKKLVTLSRSTQVCYSRHLRRIEKRFGALNVDEIEPMDVVSMIEDAALTWGESNLLLVTAKCLFTHACGKKLINVNPCIGIMLSSLLGARPAIRKRLMLTREELHLLLNANMRRPNAQAIRILLGTGVRGAELFTAKWEDVHLQENRWHIPESKTGAAMDVPLAQVVVQWFEELQAHACGSAFVLPARSSSRAERRGGDTHVGKDTVRESIDYWINRYKPAIRRFTPHDLRSTMKSHMRALGVPRDISEMCLNHKLTGVEGIYDRHNYYEERRQALLTWVEFLVACEHSTKQAPAREVEMA